MRIAMVIILAGAALAAIAIVLRGIRHIMPPIISNQIPPMSLRLTSADFDANGSIPAAFTCDNDHAQSPELIVEGVPDETQSLVLIMEDLDIPQSIKTARNIETFDHWIVFNIPPDTTHISSRDLVGTVGVNGAGKHDYAPPCPPTNMEPTDHRYIFTLYALDSELPLEEGARKEDVLGALEGHVIAQDQLIGRYNRAR